jgi:hypothetical protein
VGGHAKSSDRSAVNVHLLVVAALVVVVASLVPFEISASAAGNQMPVVAVPYRVNVVKVQVPTSVLGQSTVRLASSLARPDAVRAHSSKPRTTKPRKPQAPKMPATAIRAPVIRPTTSTPAPPVTAQPSGYGCGDALAYLKSHAAPGFTFECPGYADGHQAMTCVNIAGLCPGSDLIAISTPCAAAYMNEASNSWVVLGKSDAPIDPYGYCSDG